MAQQADIEINDQGSIVMFTPRTPQGEKWIQENLEFESWQMMGPSLCLDHRPAQDVVYLMEEAGLTFSS
jgi:hypothetical protein